MYLAILDLPYKTRIRCKLQEKLHRVTASFDSGINTLILLILVFATVADVTFGHELGVDFLSSLY